MHKVISNLVVGLSTLWTVSTFAGSSTCGALFEKHSIRTIDSLIEKAKYMDIRFRVDLMGYTYSIGMFKAGIQVGTVELSPSNSWSPTIYTTHSKIDESLRGEGLGSLLYLVAGRFGSKSNLLVESTNDGGSSMARKVWERFQSLGIAKRLPSRLHRNSLVYQFDKEAIESNQFAMLDSLTSFNISEISR